MRGYVWGRSKVKTREWRVMTTNWADGDAAFSNKVGLLMNQNCSPPNQKQMSEGDSVEFMCGTSKKEAGSNFP